MADKPVTIRTLDIGADKYPTYMRSIPSEPNPFLGWRSIRISLEVEEIFKTQCGPYCAPATWAGFVC